jgi:hypothetical protein
MRRKGGLGHLVVRSVAQGHIGVLSLFELPYPSGSLWIIRENEIDGWMAHAIERRENGLDL